MIMFVKHTWESEMSHREINPEEIATRPSHAGRRVLVTGAGRGIGRAIAQRFAARGAMVGVADMNEADINETVRLIEVDGKGGAIPLVLDVADYASVEKALGDAGGRIGGPFDTVVNNAGISPKHEGVAHKIWEMDPAEWNRVVAVNLSGCFNTIRALSPSMLEAKAGWIVNMSSVAGKTYSPIVACHYAATKSALIGFTKHLAAELGPFGVRVNAIAPGRIETPMVRAVAGEVNEEQVRMTPMGRLGAPEEVADLALYLTSPEASFVTGQTIDVAGGLYMT
jgi:3-oxoacyl-[acyl-carrier protein] reductase